jgi:hypothetical protein
MHVAGYISRPTRRRGDHGGVATLTVRSPADASNSVNSSGQVVLPYCTNAASKLIDPAGGASAALQHARGPIAVIQ